MLSLSSNFSEEPTTYQSEYIIVVRRAAASNSTILLLGETGTGKEVFAKTIHHWSPRRDRPFVVNCVALSEELLESELFGHERAVVLSAHDRITSEDLAPGVLTGSADSPTPEVSRSFHEAVTAHKRQLVREALHRSGGNQSKAASALGLRRTYLSRLIKELQVGEKG